MKYKDSYEDFSADPAQQQGNYLALSFDSEDADKIETKIISGDVQDYIDLTNDKYCVYRIKDTNQKIEIKLTKEGKEKK